ncbi:MAG: hypothetical protein OEV00_07470, partial [Acidobacteriota bacterium]|nr:hypothetical protein [Acidobacteriota bacterium]
MPFRRHPSIVLLSLTIFVASFALTLAAPAADDDTYLLELESADADATLDRSRLSLLLDDVRGRLWASRGAVRRLQSTIDVTTDRSIRVSLGSEYSAHDEALVAMKLALPALLEDPQSVDLLFDVLRSGEKAC